LTGPVPACRPAQPAHQFTTLFRREGLQAVMTIFSGLFDGDQLAGQKITSLSACNKCMQRIRAIRPAKPVRNLLTPVAPDNHSTRMVAVPTPPRDDSCENRYRTCFPVDTHQG